MAETGEGTASIEPVLASPSTVIAEWPKVNVSPNGHRKIDDILLSEPPLDIVDKQFEKKFAQLMKGEAERLKREKKGILSQGEIEARLEEREEQLRIRLRRDDPRFNEELAHNKPTEKASEQVPDQTSVKKETPIDVFEERDRYWAEKLKGEKPTVHIHIKDSSVVNKPKPINYARIGDGQMETQMSAPTQPIEILINRQKNETDRRGFFGRLVERLRKKNNDLRPQSDDNQKAEQIKYTRKGWFRSPIQELPPDSSID